jgi:predicted neutral ceramidase superfamily lipid hydrolase
MAIKSNDSVINKLHLFTKKLPDSSVIFSLLFLLSISTGIMSVLLINYRTIGTELPAIIANGILGGILVILIPTLLTVLIVKTLKRGLRIKYVLFISMLGAVVYSLFIILASAIFQIVGNYSLATIIVLVGDASIYGWWFFVDKVVLGQKKKAVVFAAIQPVFNILVYLAASGVIFAFVLPLGIILIKLFAGILIFLLISYGILYMFEGPVKRNLGFGAISVFSQVVQNWLFDLDTIVAEPMGGNKFGIHTDIDVSTIVFKKSDKSIMAAMFAPSIHYGPVGIMGGSDFPYQLEKYFKMKYNAPLFVMHCAVNEDNNPVSSSQFNAVRDVLDNGIKNSRKIGDGKTAAIEFYKSTHKTASVSIISMDKLNLATFTRAPNITEDIAPESNRLFKELLETKGREAILIDAHNSRYETAPVDELSGVTLNSKYMNEYVNAIKGLGKPKHTAKKIKIGVSSIDIYDELGRPEDLAPGKLNVIVFAFNGFKYAIVSFNANNLMPNFRMEIVERMKKMYGITGDVYTTDTHFVNSLYRNASNVLGRETKLKSLIPFIDQALKEALLNIEPVDVYYKKDTLKGFHIWGPDVREKMVAVITSVTGLAKILVPAIVAAGFIIASWIISLV